MKEERRKKKEEIRFEEFLKFYLASYLLQIALI